MVAYFQEKMGNNCTYGYRELGWHLIKECENGT
jgi:hypothetical protein